MRPVQVDPNHFVTRESGMERVSRVLTFVDGVKVNSLLMLHDRVLSILGMNSNAMPMNYVKKPPCTNT